VTNQPAEVPLALVSLLASDPDVMADPYIVWSALRDHTPVLRIDDDTVAVSGYDDVKFALRDTEFFHQPTFDEYAPRIAPRLTPLYTSEQIEAFYEVGRFEQLWVSRSGDGDAHDRLRRIAFKAFSPAVIKNMESRIRQYTSDQLDALSELDVADLKNVAYEIPLLVICDILGVPHEDREFIHDLTGSLGRNRMGMEPAPLISARDVLRPLRQYVEEEILPRHRSGETERPPLVEALMAAEGGDRLSQEETTAMFVTLFFGGHHTTSNLIATGMLSLLENRDQYALLCNQPDLTANATEELLRYVSPVQWLPRDTFKPYDFGGVIVEPGQRVLAMMAAANRDPRFDEPDRLDITRSNAREHVGFGFGLHLCLGATLARLEGRIAFEQISHRFPDMELAADPASLKWSGHASLRGLDSLPVSVRGG
jgi:cytochrome P450